MIKNHWRDLAKSSGSHVDPNKTEQLRRTKSDTENNVTRIFKLIKNEDLGKKDSSPKGGNLKGTNNEKELIELLENFYQQYQSLYVMYDHLIGESRKIVRGRKVRPAGNKGEDPTSSDSDSEYFSSDELENRNAKLENHEQQKITESGNHDLKTENWGLKVMTLSRSSSEEKEAINMEFLAALKKANADITNEDPKNKVDERVGELSALVEAHEHHGTLSITRVKELERNLAVFKTDLESLYSQKGDLEALKEGKVAEAKQLVGDENVALHPRIIELELVLKDKNDKISDLMKKLEDAKSATSKLAYWMAQTSNLELEVESLHAQKKEMEEIMAAMENETSAQAKVHTDKINAMKQELESLRCERAETGLQLDRNNREISQERHEIDTLKEELKRKDASERQMSEERQRYLKQVKDMELQVHSLRSHKKKLEEKRRSEMRETDNLRREGDGLRAKIVELGNTVSERGEEVSALCKVCEAGKNEASTQLMSLMTQVSGLKLELDSLKQQNSRLALQREEENMEWLKRLTEVENEMEKKLLGERQRFLDQVWDKEQELESLNNQKTHLENQIASKTHDNDMLRNENDGLNARIFELEKTLTKRENKVEALHRECEDGHNEAAEAANKLTALTTQVNDLKHEMDTLQTKKRQLELQIETLNKERGETEMERKIGDQERVIKEQEDNIKKITKEYSIAKMWFPESKLNLQLAEKKIEELAKKNRVHFEDSVRLLAQRIRVAEQIHNEIKESYRTMKENYEKETREMKKQLAFYEDPHKRIKGIFETAQRTLNRLERVASTFDKGHGNLLDSISRISDEVKLAKSWVKKATSDIKRLKHEAGCLAAQLDEKEEHESLLKEKVWKLEATASKEAGEKMNLMTNFSQLEKQVAKMEKMLKEKDEDLLNLGEEKREVIKQLCMLIDHHRTRYDDLKEVISKRSGRPAM